ncbi:MAG: hypothetical protein SVS85_02635 [Candidatus Nanohaloarchaea archaeon]|nr:hypothetical protein [Candidatus Nanohaloarchaea archaeon]
MTLSLRFVPEVAGDWEELEGNRWEEIRGKLGEVVEQGLGHPDVKLVPNPTLERPVWQLTVKEEITDHRVFLDLDDSTLVVLAVWHADYTHGEEDHLEEVGGRQI